MKFYFTLIALFFILIINSRGQITVSNHSPLSSIGNSWNEFTRLGLLSSFPVDVKEAGGPRNWTFNPEDYQHEEAYTTLNTVQEVPARYKSHFSGADFSYFVKNQKTSNDAYSFWGIDDSKYQFYGAVGAAEVENNWIFRSKPRVYADFPLSLGKTWECDFTDSVYTSETVQMATENHIEAVVDAYGTITIPEGTFDCLRIRHGTTQNQKFYMNGSVTEMPINYVEYMWVTREHGFVVYTSTFAEDEASGQYIQISIRSRTQTFIGEGTRNNLKNNIILKQNYPNPFNNETKIEYYLTQAGHTRLRLFDISGRKVATLINGYQESGWHSCIWNGKDRLDRPLSSGTYFCQITYNQSTIKIGKMLLLK